jgi:hypothetical protein
MLLPKHPLDSINDALLRESLFLDGFKDAYWAEGR